MYLLSKSLKIACQCNIKGNFSKKKKTFNNLLHRNHKGDEVETWHACLVH